MTVEKTKALVAAAREKLHFLHGNFSLIIAWPILALAVALVGWGMLISGLHSRQAEHEAYALREAAALSRGFSSQLNRTIEAVDQVLLHVKYEWELSNRQLRLENVRKKGLFPDSSFFNVAIIDRNGNVVTSAIPRANIVHAEDRQFFLVQKLAMEDSLYIGTAIRSRISERDVIPFSRRLADKDGNFDGVVLVSLNPGYLTANYDETVLGKDGLLAIIGVDEEIRASRTGTIVHPPDTPALLSVPRLRSSSGSLLLPGKQWFIDGRNRYVGWDALEHYPLTAMTGLDQQAAMAPFEASRAASIRTGIWATSGLAAFTLVAMALSMLLARRKYQLERTQATYRMATEGGSEGFYIARPLCDANGKIVDFLVLDSNNRGAEFVRQRREELIGKKISMLYKDADTSNVMSILREAMETGGYESDVEVPGTSPFTARWVHLKVVRADDDLAVTLRDVSEARAHVEELERRGNEDALTGLPNRHWVHGYLPRAIESAAANRSMLALLFIDLDGFKKINDTMGHAAGDELLRNAGRRLCDAVRPHDHVARLGGDEFLVIIENIVRKSDAAHVAERVLQAFRSGFRLSQGVHSVGTSIGISMFPDDGENADTLLRHADIAMYSAKTSGKGNYRFYDQKFYDALRARLEQETELRHAIEQDQFIMYYQPRIDVSTGATSSMEALVRWAHPLKGVLEPLEFIPLAEETGLIIGLGELVIEKVCAQLAYWSRRGEELVPVSINVSPRQFNEVDIAAILSAALTRHGVDPKLVEVELTESSMMGESPDVWSALKAIRRMGVKLLVDDFGTGYSSLSQLQRLDFDVLKVDRAFTAEIEKSERGNVFFKAIITMAHALGMRVVAEGVENEKQINILKFLRCDEIQGFYISRPIPPTELQPIQPKWFIPSAA